MSDADAVTGVEPPSGALTEEDLAQPQPEKKSTWRTLVHALDPRFLLALADDQPVVIKQFAQFCLILIYPAHVAGVLFGLLVYATFYVTVYPVLWVLFWPVRAWMKKNRPDEYAASRQK